MNFIETFSFLLSSRDFLDISNPLILLDVLPPSPLAPTFF
jgi:hypothetical protein